MNTTVEYFITDVGWRYSVGIPVHQATEVLSLTPDQICPLPSPHPALLGVIGWRGQLIWTIALDAWLGLTPAKGLLAGTRPVIVLQQHAAPHTGGRSIACLVHRLQSIEAVDPDRLAALPSLFPASLRPYFRGQVLDSQGLIVQDQCLFQPETWRMTHHDCA